MPFRERVKKAFGGKKTGNNSRSGPAIEYYKPDEIPRPRYCGKLDQVHQEKLQAFSFADAFRSRRNSAMSSYSPSCPKSQSRRQSRISRVSRSDVDGTSLRRRSANLQDGPEIEEYEGAEVDGPRDAALADIHEDSNNLNLQKAATLREPGHDTPFSAEELERAMTAATVKVQSVEVQ